MLIGLWGEFRTKAKGRGFTFDVAWIGEALDETEKAQAGRKIKGSAWVYFRGILDEYAQQGGPVRDGPTEPQARATFGGAGVPGLDDRARVRRDRGQGKAPGRCVCWEDLPESLRRRIKEQAGPIRGWLESRETASQS